MKTLNFIPLPIPGESPTSLIKRLALHNGYGNCSKFVEHHMRYKAPKATALLQGSRFETLLISQVGQSLHERIHQGFYRLVDQQSPLGAFMIGTVIIGRRLLRPKKAALCTECVKEGWERSIKDICLSSHCPIHNRHYLFACPHCQRKLIWKNQSSLRCVCGGTLESPICSPEEALPEKRLLEILQSGDQNRLDHLLSLISLLGVPRNRISTSCPPLIFSSAAALACDDHHGAATALSFIIDTSDAFEIDIMITKLSPTTSQESLSLLKHELKTSSTHKNFESPPIVIPTKCMATLLGIGKRKWREIYSSPNHCKQRFYTKQEARQIKDTLDTSRQLGASKKSTEQRTFMAMYYTRSETASLLGITNWECTLLHTLKLLSPPARVSSRFYFKKDDVDHFRSNYISVKALAAHLNTSTARVRRAIRNTPSVTALDNQFGCSFLVKNEEIELLQNCLDRLPPVNRKLGAKRNLRTCVATRVRLMSLSQAALQLKIHTNTVTYYRDLGLIRCADNNTLRLSASDIENFYARYTTCAMLAKELKIGENRVAQLLEPLKIFPISGGVTNGNPLSVYDRSTLPTNLEELTNPTHDSFGEFWTRAEVYSLDDAAQQLGIQHSDFQKIFTLTIRPARALQYRNVRQVTPDEIACVSSFLSALSKLSIFLRNRGITHAAFSRRFIHSKFVYILKINNEEYLNSSDIVKLDTLLDKYCTPDEAGKILHLSTVQIYHLRQNGQLPAVFPPGYEYKNSLFERSRVLQLLKLRSCETRQRYTPYSLQKAANLADI